MHGAPVHRRALMSSLGLALVAMTAVITMAANFLMRAGITRSGGFNPPDVPDALVAFLRLLFDPLFAIGFLAYFFAGLVWFRVVASEPLSLAYPLLVSMTFALVTSGSVLLFNEPLSLQKICGLLVILTGIAMVSLAR